MATGIPPAGTTPVLGGPAPRTLFGKIFEDPTQRLTRKFLTERERIFYADPPAALSFVFGIWWVWVLLAAAVWYVLQTGFDGLPAGLLVIFGTMGYAAAKWLERFYTRYVITSLRVIRMRGIFRRTLDWMPLGRIQDVTFKQSPVERILGFADLTIHSASEALGLKKLDDVANPEDFHRILTYCVEAKNANVNLTDEAMLFIKQSADERHKVSSTGPFARGRASTRTGGRS